jgi:disulfide bond formation protein DsbB
LRVASIVDPLAAPAYRNGAMALLIALGAISTALAFEHVGGLAPCPLCLQQRWAYYAAIPALFLALILTTSGRPTAAGLLFLFVSIAFLLNAGLGVYHAGAEWKFWPGPDTCGGATALPTGGAGGGGRSLLDRLQTAVVVRCDEASWRFLGLSFAGWNVVTSMLLWIMSQAAAFGTIALRAEAPQEL